LEERALSLGKRYGLRRAAVRRVLSMDAQQLRPAIEQAARVAT
jgi:hypothetical protein